MTTEYSNPFVLPGFGQTGEFSANPVMASMEMMRQAWQSLAGQGGFGAPSMAATLSGEELERRIGDLRAVENWLRMNLTVLSSTIQGLEVQRATLSTLKSFVNAQDASALESLLGRHTAKPAGSAQTANTRTEQDPPASSPPAADAAHPRMDAEQAVAATQAWWEMLRKQFDTLAAATAASLQPAVTPADAPATPVARAPRKAASAKAGKAAAAPRSAASPQSRASAKPAGRARRTR